jgi:hypothetical protein
VPELSPYINAFLVPLMSVGGAVAAVLATIARYRDKRVADMHEATAVWQSLAEGRIAENEALRDKVKLREEDIERLRERNDYLWTELLKRADVSALKADPADRI